MMHFWVELFPPGLFQSQEVLFALWMGLIAACISGVIGVFVVIRGQSFVGHVFTDIGAAGGSGSILIGLNAWYGFLSFGILAGLGVESLGTNVRNRDVATGIILSFAMGLGALFLYFDTRMTSNAGTTMLVLFGSIFVVRSAILPIVLTLGFGALVVLIILYRPLILCSISPEAAMVLGLPVRLISFVFIILLAVAVEEGSMVLGALLSTALLIGPAATAIRLTSRIGWASILSALIGMVTTCIGIILSYDSYNWLPSHRGWPVSFFIASLIFIFYLSARLINTLGNRSPRPREVI